VKRQQWFCEECRKKGSIVLEGSEGVMSVIMDIMDDHSRISFLCPQPVGLIRVVNELNPALMN